MNHEQRFRAVMGFQPVDRLPRIEWATWWDQTLRRWQGEGLGTCDRYEAYQELGLDPYWQHWFSPAAATCPAPPGHGQGLVRDEAGYEALLPHLYPPVEPALPGLARWAEAQRRGEGLVWITLEGFFWFPRRLLGIERHFYAFFDQPDLIHRINRDLAEHHVALLRRLGSVCRPVFMTFAEDMSYNHGPMLSEALFDEFLAPYYRRVVPLLEEMGTLVMVDTDGDLTAMIPWLQGVGIQGALPLERQAGVDAAAIRRAFPTFRMIGHYDKMVMPRGERAMREEFERLLPVMRSGGFIPSVDHQTPPGVSLEQYRCYVRLLAEYTQRAAE